MSFLKRMLGDYLGSHHGGGRNSHHGQTSQHGNYSINPGRLSCPRCKVSLEPGARFCSQCGNSL
ncbi:TPA: zinc-ribbon domain-containing protein [Legionella pneumophila]